MSNMSPHLPRWKVLLLGQFISFLYFAGSAITSTIQTVFRTAPPSLFAFLVYGCLSLFLIPVYWSRRLHTASANKSKLVFALNHNDKSTHSKAPASNSTNSNNSNSNGKTGALLWRTNQRQKQKSKNEFVVLLEMEANDDQPETDTIATTAPAAAAAITHSEVHKNNSNNNHNHNHSSDSSFPPQYSHYFLTFIPIRGNLATYCVIGWIDYLGTVCTIVALKYTPLTSYTILWSLVTPAAMLFSKCFLVRKYRFRHLLGVGLCIAGVILNTILDGADDHHQHNQDTTNPESMQGDNIDDIEQRYPHKVFGDAVAAMGAALFGLLDILCEYSLEQFDGGTSEYLGVTAFIAATLALSGALLWEQDEIGDLWQSLRNSQHALHLLVLLVIVDVGSYYFSCRFLEISESALLNLSTLTESLMAVAFSVIVEKVVPLPLFFVGLTWTIFGLIIYETSPSPIVDSYHLLPTLELPTILDASSAGYSSAKRLKDGDTTSSTQSTVLVTQSPSDEEPEISSHTSTGSSIAEHDDFAGDMETLTQQQKAHPTSHTSRWLPQFIAANKRGVPALRRQRTSVSTANMPTTSTTTTTAPLLSMPSTEGTTTLDYKKY